MRSIKRSEILACLDAVALEVASKIEDYKRLGDEVEHLRVQVLNREDVPRFVDTHALVSNAFSRRRTA